MSIFEEYLTSTYSLWELYIDQQTVVCEEKILIVVLKEQLHLLSRATPLKSTSTFLEVQE